MESWVQRWRPCTNAFCDFSIPPFHLSKVLRLPRKSDARSYAVLHLSRKIMLANLQIWCSKMQPLSGNQRPDLLTFLMNMSFVLRLPREMHLWRCSSNVPRLPSFLSMLQNLHVLLTFGRVENHFAPATQKQRLNVQKWSEPLVLLTFWLRNVLPATTACTFSTSQLPKVVRTWCALCIFTSKCPSRHNAVHFFDISTSKSAQNGVFCTFWLRNVLRATTACTFSTSQLPILYIWLRNVLRATTVCTFATSQHPKVLRTWGVLYILTSKRASHNGVHFFISHLARWLRTRCFSEPTFRPSGATNHWKKQCFATFLPFRAPELLSSDFLFSDLLSSTLLFSLTLPVSAFHLSILSEVWLLNFLRWYVVHWTVHCPISD